MFEHVPLAPPDPIFGLTEAFRRDPNPHKINLGAGVYQDEGGHTPVLRAVKRAERRLLGLEPTKSYLPIAGLPEYACVVQRLLLGAGHPAIAEGRAVTVQTPGGTGALRVAGDVLKLLRGGGTLFLSDPTWVNHVQVFEAVGLRLETYPYFDAAASALDFEALMASLAHLSPGDAVLLHACCHNPTGVDPSPEQWRQMADLLADRRVLPVLDFAYQGFAAGLDEDAGAIRELSRRLPEVVVCNSFSKNFGLYNERIGGLTVIAADPGQAQAVLSQVKRCIRANYSNPPAHGAAIVATVLGDPKLRQLWEAELAEMRLRIREMREQLATGLEQRGVRLHPEGNAFMVRQRGMFSFSRLGREQVERLRQEFSIYLVGSGRINIAGITRANLPRLCDAIAAVVL